MIVTLIAAIITYVLMVVVTKYRLPVAVLGLASMLIYGTVSGSIHIAVIFQRFPVEIIILIIILALFTKTFECLDFFKYLSDFLVRLSKGNRMKATISLIFLIYIASLFMNNLTVILLFTFLCIEISIQLKIPVVPVLVSAVIASNIGGAALPWADTPAVILTLYTDFTLIDFLAKLFLPCLFYVLLLAAYLVVYCNCEVFHFAGSIHE